MMELPPSAREAADRLIEDGVSQAVVGLMRLHKQAGAREARLTAEAAISTLRGMWLDLLRHEQKESAP